MGTCLVFGSIVRPMFTTRWSTPWNKLGSRWLEEGLGTSSGLGLPAQRLSETLQAIRRSITFLGLSTWVERTSCGGTSQRWSASTVLPFKLPHRPTSCLKTTADSKWTKMLRPRKLSIFSNLQTTLVEEASKWFIKMRRSQKADIS